MIVTLQYEPQIGARDASFNHKSFSVDLYSHNPPLCDSYTFILLLIKSYKNISQVINKGLLAP